MTRLPIFITCLRLKMFHCYPSITHYTSNVFSINVEHFRSNTFCCTHEHINKDTQYLCLILGFTNRKKQKHTAKWGFYLKKKVDIWFIWNSEPNNLCFIYTVSHLSWTLLAELYETEKPCSQTVYALLLP